MVEPPESRPRPTMMQRGRRCIPHDWLSSQFKSLIYSAASFGFFLLIAPSSVQVPLSVFLPLPVRRTTSDGRGRAGISHSPPNRVSPRVWHHRPPLGPSECHLSSIEKSGRDPAIVGMTSVLFRWKVDEVILGKNFHRCPLLPLYYHEAGGQQNS